MHPMLYKRQPLEATGVLQKKKIIIIKGLETAYAGHAVPIQMVYAMEILRKENNFLFLSFFSMPYKTMKKSTKAFSVLQMRHTSKLILDQHVTFQLSQVMRLFNKTLWQSNNKWMSVHHKARVYITVLMTDFDVMVKDPMIPRVLGHLVHVCKLWSYVIVLVNAGKMIFWQIYKLYIFMAVTKLKPILYEMSLLIYPNQSSSSNGEHFNTKLFVKWFHGVFKIFNNGIQTYWSSMPICYDNKLHWTRDYIQYKLQNLYIKVKYQYDIIVYFLL